MQAFQYVYDGVSDDVEESPIFDCHVQPVKRVPGYDGEYSEVFDLWKQRPRQINFHSPAKEPNFRGKSKISV